MKSSQRHFCSTALVLCLFATGAPGNDEATSLNLTEAGEKLEAHWSGQLESLGSQLAQQIPKPEQAKGETLNQFLSSDSLDAALAKYVVLKEATPAGLARFAQQGREQWQLVEGLLPRMRRGRHCAIRWLLWATWYHRCKLRRLGYKLS